LPTQPRLAFYFKTLRRLLVEQREQRMFTRKHTLMSCSKSNSSSSSLCIPVGMGQGKVVWGGEREGEILLFAITNTHACLLLRG
jgi:hypothetical protein